MDLEKLPWRDGVAAVLAVVLLKMLWDAVYRKIPRGFRSVRMLLQSQNAVAKTLHDDSARKLEQIEIAIKELGESGRKESRSRKTAAARQKKPPAS